MSPFFAVFLVLLLGSSSYAAGRLHGQLSYRLGYRCGYRQGYFDGDRGAWNRRRRDAQAVIASLAMPSPTTSGELPAAPGSAPAASGSAPAASGSAPAASGSVPAASGSVSAASCGVRNTLEGSIRNSLGQGTTYRGASFVGSAANGGRHSTDALARGNV